MTCVRMTGFGVALPPVEISNHDLVAWHGRRDPQWFEERMGVRTGYSCRRLDTGEALSDEYRLSVEACGRALEDAGVEADQVDALVLATISPPHVVFPDPACPVHHGLGMRNSAQALTLTTGCAGTLNGLLLAESYIRSGLARTVLVVSASTMLSGYVRPHLRDEMWLFASIFGDAVSAVVLRAEPGREAGVCGPRAWGTDADRDVARSRFGGSAAPLTPDNIAEAVHDYPHFDFRAVPGNLRDTFSRLYTEALAAPDMRGRRPDWVLFNMSNGRVQRQWLAEQGIPRETSYFNIERVGNCGAASLGVLLHDFVRARMPRPGDLALMMSVGPGLQYASATYRF